MNKTAHEVQTRCIAGLVWISKIIDVKVNN